MTVYIITDDDRPAPGVMIRGVFSTSALAHKALEGNPGCCGNDEVVLYEIDPQELD